MFKNKMDTIVAARQWKRPPEGGLVLRSCLSAVVMAGFGTFIATVTSSAAEALNLYNGLNYGNNWEVSLDTTVSFSSFYRVNSPSATLAGPANYNGNDGDSNFQHGFVGNIFEVLPVLDIKNGDFGAHFSGEYFVNTSYLTKNQNDQQATANPFNLNGNGFAPETVNSNGHNGRMLDAFVYDSVSFGAGQGQTLTLKAGQQTLFWGQSLYFGSNGISGGQAPVDTVAAQDLVNPQSQQIFLPVGQIVLTYQPDTTYTLQAYYQYQWEPTALQGVGSYFSTSDVTGPGAQRIIAVPNLPGLGNLYLFNTKALTPPSQNGQFGASIQATYGDYDVGLYGLRFDAKTPQVVTNITGLSSTPHGESLGTYNLVYPRDIWLEGTSLSTTVGSANVAGEISAREHMPLVSPGGSIAPGAPNNANGSPLYPVGNTLTTLVSSIYGSPALKFDPGGVTITGEVEYVRLLGVTANKALLAPGRSSAAAAFDAEVEPAYLDVLPQLEIQFPVSVSYNFAGNSQVDSTMNHGTGSITVGVVATYRQTWDASLNYVDYFGKATNINFEPNAAENVDRGYVTFNIQHTF